MNNKSPKSTKPKLDLDIVNKIVDGSEKVALGFFSDDKEEGRVYVERIELGPYMPSTPQYWIVHIIKDKSSMIAFQIMNRNGSWSRYYFQSDTTVKGELEDVAIEDFSHSSIYDAVHFYECEMKDMPSK